MCVMSFLDSCISEGFYADLRDQFIEAGEKSKLGELKPQLLDGFYVEAYQYCSIILAENNGGQDIKSITESSSSVHKVNLKNVKRLRSETELNKVINYLSEELLSLFYLELVKRLLYACHLFRERPSSLSLHLNNF